MNQQPQEFASMRALVVAPQPFFTPRGTPFSVYHRTAVMCQQGVNIDVLTYGEGWDVVIPGARLVRIPRFAILGPVKVGPSLLKFFLDIWIFFWLIGLLTRRRYHFVHAHEEAVFMCLLLKPLFRFKFVYDMHSSLPQQLTNFDFSKSKLLINLFRGLEDASLRHSKAVITICPDLATYAKALINDPRKHFLIENSIFDRVKLAAQANAETSEQCPDDDLPERLEGRPVVIYAGTLEVYQGIDLLLEAFSKVVKDVSDAMLLIVGGTQEQVEAYKAKAAGLCTGESVLFTGHKPQATAQSYCRKADVQVSPRISGTNTPLKIYEQLANGVPLVATEIRSHTQVIDESVAFMAAPEPAALAARITEALTDPDKSVSRAKAAQKLYAEKYSREVYVSKIRMLLQWIS